MRRRSIAALALVAGSSLAVYLPVVTSLVRQWASDDNSSHGFVVVPFALLLAWKERRALIASPAAPTPIGLVIVMLSMAMFIAGRFAAELFLMRVSLLGLVTGSVLFLGGPSHLRRLAFPLLLAALAVPLPALVLNQVAFPLQLLASRAGEAVVSAAGLPILREGNILILPETRLEVVEACSGIRSLAALLTLSLIIGKLTEPRRWARAALAALTIPVAIGANAARVAGTGLAAAWIGPDAAEGFFHTFSGWLVFVAAFCLLVACARLLRRVRRLPLTVGTGALAVRVS